MLFLMISRSTLAANALSLSFFFTLFGSKVAIPSGRTNEQAIMNNNPLNYWLIGLASVWDYTDNPCRNAERRPVCRGFSWINRGSGK